MTITAPTTPDQCAMVSSSAASSIGMAFTETKRADTAEFRRLLYFFQKLQEPRPRVLARKEAEKENQVAGEPDGPEPIPRDLAPLVKNLSKIIGPAADKAEAREARIARAAPPATPARQRSKTIATTSLRAPPPTPTTPSRFPLQAANYPFTFKLMLHKLYDPKDWLSKVGALLADSQARYRPLADAKESRALEKEKEVVRAVFSPPMSPTKEGANTTFSPPISPTSPTFSTPPSSPAARRRALSPSKKATQVALGVSAAPEPRAVKRRIVDRRRSLTAATAEGWVYDARASAVEVEARDGERGTERRRKRVFSSVAFSEEQKAARRVVAARAQLKRERGTGQPESEGAQKRSRVG
jgi:hypothetical protein